MSEPPSGRSRFTATLAVGSVGQSRVVLSLCTPGVSDDAAEPPSEANEATLPPAGEKPDFAALFLALPSPYMVLDRDLTKVAPADILKTQVLATVVGGKAVYVEVSVRNNFPQNASK